jgi:hypothetical protein
VVYALHSVMQPGSLLTTKIFSKYYRRLFYQSELIISYYIHRAATNNNVSIDEFSVEIVTKTYNHQLFPLKFQQVL